MFILPNSFSAEMETMDLEQISSSSIITGINYQLKLLLLFLKRGLDNGYSIRYAEYEPKQKNYRLVFEYKSEKKYVAIWPINQNNTKVPLINMARDLQECYNSYTELIQELKLKITNISFVICTNIDHDLSDYLEQVEESVDSFLDIQYKSKEFKCLKLKAGEVDAILENCGELCRTTNTQILNSKQDTECQSYTFAEFLENLVFIVNPFNEDDLINITKDEIIENLNFNLIDIILRTNIFEIFMLDWMNRKKYLFHTYQKHQKIFIDSVKNRLAHLILVGSSFNFTENKGNQSDDIFINNSINELKLSLKNFLNEEPEQQFFNINTNHTNLSVLKVHQILKDSQMNRELEKYIFLQLRTLLLIQDQVLTHFKSDKINLLVIECENTENYSFEKLFKLSIDLKTIFKNYLMKKIILISETNNRNGFGSFLIDQSDENKKYTQFVDIKNNFIDLTIALQNKILHQRMVTFQGKNVRLDELVNESSTHLITPSLFSMIINNETIEIGKELSDLNEVQSYYIDRTFNKHINYLESHDHKDLELKKNIFNIEATENIDDNVVIIVAEPGMGKSTVMTQLTEETRKCNPLLWIIRINLIEFSSKFRIWTDKNIAVNQQNAMEFLSSCAFYTNHSGNANDNILSLEKELFLDFYNNGKIILFFDGFDEICPYYKETVITLLIVLKASRIRKILITTRPYGVHMELQKELCAFSYSLTPISVENQTLFLSKYLQQHIKQELGSTTTVIEDLLTWFTNAINDTDRKFFKSPLHLTMMAENFKNIFEQFEEFSGLMEYNQKLNFARLYENFINRKIFLKDSDIDYQSSKILKTMITKDHQILAILKLFGKEGLNSLELSEDNLLADIELGREKTGIIDRVINNEPIFIHQSYTEYFAAHWFAQNWDNKYRRENVKSFLLQNIFETKNIIIRKFFDYMMAYEPKRSTDTTRTFNEIHVLVLNNNKTEINKILSDPVHSLSIINSCDKAGRTALHLAAAYGYEDIVQNFIMKTQSKIDINIKDKIFDWSPLEYASKLDLVKIIQLFETESINNLEKMNAKEKKLSNLEKITSEYCDQIKALDIRFSVAAINNFKIKLGDFMKNQSQYNIVNINTTQIELSTIKIYKILTDVSEFQTVKSFIFLSLRSIQSLEENILHLENINTVVIVCERKDTIDSKKLEKLSKLLHQMQIEANIKNVISKYRIKKIILITKEDFTLNKINYDDKCVEYIFDKTNIIDLTIESREKLRKNNYYIVFKGNKIALSHTDLNVIFLKGNHNLSSVKNNPDRLKNSLKLRMSVHSNIYQLKLLMFFMIRGLKLKRRFRLAKEFDPGEKFDDLFFEYENERGLKLKRRFRLAKEFDPGEKFDDLFFEYENENKDGSIIRLIQTITWRDDSKTISLNDLITEENGQFSLQQYFISYRKIIKNPKFTRINTELKDLIICTNIGLHEDLKVNFKPVVGSDVILDMKRYRKEAQILKLKNDFSIKSTIESIFKNTSESYRLAKNIAKCNKLELKDELLRVYHGVLAKDVFEITENKTKCYSKFRNSFLDLSDNNKTAGFIRLRENFFSYLNKKGNLNLVELKSKKIPTSRSFGKVFKLNDNPEIKDSEQFAKDFAASVKLAQNNIVQISRKNKTIKDNINELAGYLLIKKDESENDIYFLSSAFFDDNCPLPADLTIFRSNLKAALQNEGIIVRKDQYKFRITKLYTCYEDELFTNVSLPDECVTDEEIKGFFNKFVFAVNQPNEVELGKIIATEILADVNVNNDFIVEKFQSYMLNWMKERIGTFLTYEDGNSFFEEAKTELHKLMLIEITCDYLAKIDKFCLTFKQNAINNLQRCFYEFLNSDSTNQILNIFTEHIELSSIKFYQIIKESEDYKTKDSYIFLSSSTLVSLEDQLLLAFDSHTTKLLIIANDNATNDNDNDNLLKLIDKLKLINKLKLILNKNSYMKIIIIGSSKRILFNVAEIKNDKYEDRNINLTNLTEQSRNEILAKAMISFQGHDVNLNKLLNKKLHNVIDGNILLDLIHNQEIKVGAELPNLNKTKNYFITRTLKYYVNVNLDVQKEHKFFIVDSYQHPKGNKRMRVDEPKHHQDIVLISDNSDNEFADLCTRYSQKNIHWLKKDEQKLIWKQSSGHDLSKLREFIDSNAAQFTQPKIATDLREKVVVIVAEPGMGKSTLLTYLAVQTQKSEPTLCILTINLIDNVEIFQSWRKKRTLKEIEIKKFLYSCYFNKTNEESIKALQKNIFDYCYQQSKMIVMFDGFDEISPNYKIVVLKMLNVLKNTTIGGMWITTRPYNIQNEIENVLGTFSYSLQPISKENQISFLKSFWAQNFTEAEIDDALIDQFLGWFSKITNDKNGEFVTIPLQLRMIAEIFQNKFEKLIESGNHELSKNYEQLFGDKLNLVNLYEKFIDIKFDKILMQEKKFGLNTADPDIRTMIKDKRTIFIEDHKKFALLSLFGTRGLTKLNIEIGDLVANINKGTEKAGFVNQVINKKPIFVHKSYAEYFTALWLVDNWKENKVNSFLIEHIFKEENKGIRSFFDYLLASESNTEDNEDEPEFDIEYQNSEKTYNPLMENKFALHTYVLKNDRENLQRLLLEQRNSHEVINAIDKGGRTALHLIASYNYTETMNSVMSWGIKFDINKKDKLFGWSPLIYAEKSGSWYIAEMLLSEKADDDEMFKKICNINEKYVGPNILFTETEMTLLHIAISQGLINLTKVLIKKGIHYAAFHGEPILFESLIKHIERINTYQLYEFLNLKMNGGYTALHVAAQNGKTEAVELLLKLVECKFPEHFWEFINVKTTNGFTVLLIAAQQGKLEVVEVLLKFVEKIKPHQVWDFIKETNESGETSLHISAINGHTEIVEHLLKLVETKFPEKMLEFINAKRKDGCTALHLAAHEGKTAVVEVLLKIVEKIKPDQVWDFINEKNEFGATSLHISAGNGYTEVTEHLLKLVETKYPEKMLEFINAKQKSGFTALHLAAHKGKTAVVEVLLKFVEKMKPDQVWDFINETNKFGDTSLHISARKGHTKVAEHLLKFVETKFPEKMFEFINAKEKNGFTALHLAAEQGQTDVVEVLLKFVEKIKPDQAWDFIKGNKIGDTSLHISARHGHTKVVEHLLKLVETKFPENMLEFITAKDKSGCTALHIAAKYGKIEVIELLIKTLCKSTPDKLFEFINEKNLDGRTALHLALIFRYPDIIKTLVKDKAKVDSRDYHDTILHQAVSMNNVEILQLILNEIRRTEPNMVPFMNASDTEGDTPLMWAAQFGYMEMTKMLIEFGANLDMQNNDGETALHLATKGSYYEIVKLLLNKNANSNINDKNGKTPMKLALEIWNKDQKNENINLIMKLLSQL